LTRLECSPSSDWTPALFFGFAPVATEAVSMGEDEAAMVPVRSFKPNGFGDVEPEGGRSN
jgi:hypothetical protein